MITEEALRLAAEKSCEAYISSVEPDCVPDSPHRFSQAFEAKMKKLIRRAKHPYLRRALQRIAVVFLAVLIGGGVWLAADGQARAAVAKWFREVYETHVVYRFTGELEDGELPKYRVRKLPKSYYEDYSVGDETGQIILYVDETDSEAGAIFSYNKIHEGMLIDLLDPVGEGIDIEINGVKGQFYHTSDGWNSVIWIHEEIGVAFTLAAPLPFEELIKAAESIYIAK